MFGHFILMKLGLVLGGYPIRRWEDDIKMDLLEVGLGGGASIGSICLKMVHVAGSCECGYEPSGSIKFRDDLD